MGEHIIIFKGFAPCRRPPTAKSKQLKANSRLGLKFKKPYAHCGR
jgi:hypothetical protein